MESQPPQITPSSYGNPPPVAPRKALGIGAKIGIGCGAIVLLLIVATVIASFIFGGKLKSFAEEAVKNPARATATASVSMSGGKLEIVAEDDANKRYTLKKKATGELTTIYWDEAAQAPVTIEGDFSAIPTTWDVPVPTADPVHEPANP